METPKKKKTCPKCQEPIYLVGNSLDGSYRILTCRNKQCEHYMRILKDKSPLPAAEKNEDSSK